VYTHVEVKEFKPKESWMNILSMKATAAKNKAPKARTKSRKRAVAETQNAAASTRTLSC